MQPPPRNPERELGHTEVAGAVASRVRGGPEVGGCFAVAHSVASATDTSEAIFHVHTPVIADLPNASTLLPVWIVAVGEFDTLYG